ncbi:apolipoprotein C-II [Denticeps clupeoides]|uniref:Apolipoprotein C-II n=1 Tax=Denticeps clupeoides TaxID=299321 RepID=A0AAY4AKR9_9TELE|nr:apolipoprotein C-II-like [Denticeps clupeoides]XP_028837468.1 apolipoprotein C-II-like [Denticeps clupeoides]
MKKLLVAAILIGLFSIALAVESFTLSQAEDEEPYGMVGQLWDSLKSYYDSTVNSASGYIQTVKDLKLNEKARNLYDETTAAVTTYAGILQDQIYHIVNPE